MLDTRYWMLDSGGVHKGKNPLNMQASNPVSNI
jgi:hypothetical protein